MLETLTISERVSVGGSGGSFDSKQDTVVHNKDADDSLADWMKFKLVQEQQELEKQQEQELRQKKYEFATPKIINGPASETQESDDSDLYSFQEDTKNFRVHSDVPTVSTATTKVTSFKYEDSPIAKPMLLKHVSASQRFKNDSSLEQFEEEAEDEQDSQYEHESQEYEIKPRLITPLEEGMKFDTLQQKWVYNSTQKTVYDDELRIDDTAQTAGKAEQDGHDEKIALNDITNISQIDISFSEFKKKLISALTNAIKFKTNWDSINQINLSNQQLYSVKDLDKYVPQLTEINLNNNHLKSFEGLPNDIETLLISKNQLENDFNISNFNKFKFIKTIDLSFNKLTSLKIFLNFKCLRNLNLSHNKIESIVDLPNIETLNLSNNKIKNDLVFLNELDNLKNLNLSFNKIKRIQNLHNLTNVQVLLVNDNQLEHLEGDSTKEMKLIKLNLLNNNTEENFKSDKLWKLPNLSHLRHLLLDGNIRLSGDLKLNKLESLEINGDFNEEFYTDHLFKHLNRHLKTLSIQNNQRVNYEYLNDSFIFNYLNHLQRIDLRNCNINCSNVELVLFLQKKIDIEDIKLDGNPLYKQISEHAMNKIFEIMIKKATI